jgi:hypothetical protein
LTVALAGVGCVDAGEQDRWTGWSTLELKVRDAPLMRGNVEMRISDDSDGRRLETSTEARFFGATIASSETSTLLDAESGHTKEYQSFSKKKGRRYRFDEQGYTVEKLLRDRDDEAGDGWKLQYSVDYEYPQRADGSGPERLYDYYGMLLYLREMGLERPGDEATLHVATSRGPQEYRIRVSEARSRERSFLDLARREKVTLPVREFRLTVSPADDSAAEGFLKMEGEVEIWVEAESKTLLEIRGKVPRVPGKVSLVLSALG